MGVYSGEFLFPSDELYHHGIKGQRWGIRRFQNEDGSLTPEGEKHIRLNMKDARADLGFKQKGFLNAAQKHMAKNYKDNVNMADRQISKAAKLSVKGKDPSKNLNRAKTYLKEANTYKKMAKSYNSLSKKEQKKINSGMAFAQAMGMYGLGGLGYGVATVGYDAKMRKKLAT